MLHLNPRRLARTYPLALLASTTHCVESDEVSGVADGIRLTDTNEDILSAPTGLTLTQANRDIDLDGSVDIALLATFSGGVAGITAYEFELTSATTSGGTYTIVTTAVSQTGKCWFKANTQLFYKCRVRAIAWNGTGGTWSSLTSAVQPAPTTGAPGTPTGFVAAGIPLGVNCAWNTPPELDYSHSEIWISGTTSAPSAMLGTSQAGSFRAPWTTGGFAVYLWVRHVNYSGLKSSFVMSTGVISSQITQFDLSANSVGRSELQSGAAGQIAHQNNGTTLATSIAVGPQTRTFVSLSFKATSNTSGVTINVGSYSTTIDYISGQQYTITTSEAGGGTINISKSGGGTQAGCQVTAIGMN